MRYCSTRKRKEMSVSTAIVEAYRVDIRFSKCDIVNEIQFIVGHPRHVQGSHLMIYRLTYWFVWSRWSHFNGDLYGRGQQGLADSWFTWSPIELSLLDLRIAGFDVLAPVPPETKWFRIFRRRQSECRSSGFARETDTDEFSRRYFFDFISTRHVSQETRINWLMTVAFEDF